MKPIQYSLICLVLSSALVLTDSAVVQNMFKEKLSTVKHIVGKSIARNFQINLENLRTTNSLSCYTTQPDATVKPGICPPMGTECGILSFDVSPKSQIVHYSQYACATKDACDNPDVICQQAAKQLPWPISNCNLKCCKANLCNKPRVEGVSQPNIGSSFPLKLPGSVISSPNPPSNDLSCYVVDESGQPVEESCKSGLTECITVTAYMKPPVVPKVEVTSYGCVTPDLCSNPDVVCEDVKKRLPFPMSNCTVKCCSTNNCNTPIAEKLSYNTPALPLRINLSENLIFSPNSPTNSLSCYVVQSGQRVVSQTCPASATECLRATADVESGPHTGEKVEVLTCASKAECQYPKIVCTSIAQRVPFKIGNCEVKCCSTNNCNTPLANKITQSQPALHLPINLPRDQTVLNPPANTLSCYTVQSDQSIVTQTCPAQETECLKVTAYVQTPQKSKVEVQALSCVPASVCKNPSAVCQSIAKEIPYPISDCKVSCCTTNNCNTPDFKKTALSLPDLSVLNPPANTLSCYTVQPDQRIVPKTCPAQETECLKVTAFVQPPGQPKEEVEALSCVPASVCENREAVCQSIAKEVPYPMSDCKVSCCTTNNCNTPDFERSALYLSDLSVLNPPANTLSCYTVQPDQSIVPKTCPAQETECLKVTAFVQPPGQPKEEVEALSCVPASVCKNREAVCQSIAKEVPYPMSDCKASCCNTNNCNTPDFKSSALSLPDGLF